MDEPVEQIGGKVIDHVPPHVFERIEDGRLARTGHAGDEQQARRAPPLRPLELQTHSIEGKRDFGRCRRAHGVDADQWQRNAKHRPFTVLIGQPLNFTRELDEEGDRDLSTVSMSTIPIPLISSLPAIFGGAEATSRSPSSDDRAVIADQRESTIQ